MANKRYIGQVKGITNDGYQRYSLLIQLTSKLTQKDIDFLSNEQLKKIEFKDVDIRSLDQNALYWKIIGDCVKHPNSSFADRNKLHVYILKKANVSSVIRWTDEPNDLLKKYRAYEIIEYVTVRDKKGNPKRLAICQCFEGSSELNRVEMAELIEKAIEYADLIGLDKPYGEEWRILKYGEKTDV